MFRKIERSLALQFTVFVFVLMLINGAMFLIADFGNQVREARQRLMTEMTRMREAVPDVLEGIGDLPFLPHPLQLRIVDVGGTTIVSDALFDDLTLQQEEGFSTSTINNRTFMLLTTVVTENDERIAIVQIAEPENMVIGNLPLRSLLYVLVSILISFLTYMVGKRFAKRSLKPAENMLIRLEQFTQDASHELRTPLAVLGSSLDLALKTKRYEEGIVSAKEDLKQISTLVERLLEIARAGNLALEKISVDLSALTTNAVAKFSQLADTSDIGLHSTIKAGVTMQANETLVNQILWNLLSNAIKFTKPGGRIDIALTEKYFSVSDTGIGIAARDLPHIFGRFYQADASRSHGGFGLGLSFVKQIVTMHGWTIDVRSEEGRGTTFTVFLSLS